MSDQNRRYAPPMIIGLAGTTGLTAGRSPVVRFRSDRPRGTCPPDISTIGPIQATR